MGKTTRGLRRNGSVGGHSVEFGDLLDPIAAAPAPAGPVVAPITVAQLDDGSAVDPEPDLAGRHENPIDVTEPPTVSRFADAGVDDDRLPLHVSTKRRRRS